MLVVSYGIWQISPVKLCLLYLRTALVCCLLNDLVESNETFESLQTSLQIPFCSFSQKSQERFLVNVSQTLASLFMDLMKLSSLKKEEDDFRAALFSTFALGTLMKYLYSLNIGTKKRCRKVICKSSLTFKRKF